jgi:hypothetical protein
MKNITTVLANLPFFNRPVKEYPRLSFEEVFKKEQMIIEERRNGRTGDSESEQGRDANPSRQQEQSGNVYEQAHRKQFFGLAFSGGGIRSATFNLGILQALAKSGVIKKIDYLSTVSGGGYIGSWLMGWLNRETHPPIPPATGPRDCSAAFDDVLHDLAEAASNEKEGEGRTRAMHDDEKPSPIRWLRRYSNYLTPRKGALSLDTWESALMYCLNLAANLILLTLVFMCVLSAAILLRDLYRVLPQYVKVDVFLITGAILLLISTIVTVFNLYSLSPAAANGSKKFKFPTSEKWVFILAVLPAMLAGLCFASGITHQHLSFVIYLLVVPIYPIGWMIGMAIFGRFAGVSEGHPFRFHFGYITWAAIAAAVLGAVVLNAFIPLIQAQGKLPIIGWPIVILCFAVTGALHIIFAATCFTGDAREWWCRLGGLLFVRTGLVIALFVIAWYGPDIMCWFSRFDFSQVDASGVKKSLPTTGIIGLLVWIASTASGVFLGKSSDTRESFDKHYLNIIIKVAPFIFFVGFFLMLSQLTHVITGWGNRFVETELHACNAVFDAVLLLTIGIIIRLLSKLMKINDFSLHGIYRSRLVRCYLGASNSGRKAQPFIDFDSSDEISLHDLRKQTGPYPIINAALNLTKGKNLAWQDRKAASFVFTPTHCGYQFPGANFPKKNMEMNDKEDWMAGGFRDVRWYENPKKPIGWYEQQKKPIDGAIMLGDAIATSGAAASPNMGYHSSMPLAFLMTVFNVRLGIWLGNPVRKLPDAAERNTPNEIVSCLMQEAFGSTGENMKYVYLSDGGHFENLGIYELVRRRCHFIIACDASADQDMNFSDLGNAVEKCRTDFGISIDIDVASIKRDKESGKSKWHCAVGKILYSEISNGAPDGIILYIKPSLTGEEPIDIDRYSMQSPKFPHESTADQWFGESQFESYRMLGEHIGDEVFKPAAIDPGLPRPEWVQDLFDKLNKRWSRGSIYTAKSFTEHSRALNGIMERLRGDNTLKFLDVQLIPEWPAVVKNDKSILPPSLEAVFGLPKTGADLRAGFYFCTELIQLMENVYLDLNLETEYDHPDNRGWMNLFRHWSWSAMFRVTWSVCAGTFGARFQSFCEAKLDLEVGELTVSGRLTGSAGKEEELLDPIEDQMLREFIENHRASRGINPERVSVHQIILSVKNLIQNEKPLIRFVVGIVAIEQEGNGSAGRIIFFRIRDHLRTMGFGRKAMQFIIENKLGYSAITIPEQKDWHPDLVPVYLKFREISQTARGGKETGNMKRHSTAQM